MKGFDRKEAGDAGERTALDHLTSKGLTIVLRNYTCRGGEIDLVMLDGTTLVLIEVRMRRNNQFGGAAASVTVQKQKRIVLAAKHLLLTRPDLARHRARFDVVALTPSGNGALAVEWIRDAFRAS